MNEFVQEHVTGMNIVQAFNREEKESSRLFKDECVSHRKANIVLLWRLASFFPVVEMLSATSGLTSLDRYWWCGRR